MNLGPLFEMQRPYEGTDIDWNTPYEESIAQVALADQVGLDRPWFVEHHFRLGFSGSPCPEVMFGTPTKRTKNIRIAERVAMVATGASSSEPDSPGTTQAGEDTSTLIASGTDSPSPCTFAPRHSHIWRPD